MIYYNKISNKTIIDYDKMQLDFNVFKIWVKIDYSSDEKISILKEVKEITDDIYAIKYDKSDTAYILVKKDSLSKKVIEDRLSTITECKVEEILLIKGKIDENIKDVIYNLLLFKEEYGKSICDEILIGNAFNYIVEAKKIGKNNRLITLAFSVKNGDLRCNLQTFTKLTDLKGTKYETKYPKYIINGKVLTRIYDKSKYNENELYVLKGSDTHKNTLSTFDASEKKIDKSKFTILNYVYKLFKECEYINNFNFENIELFDFEKEMFDTKKDAIAVSNCTRNKINELVNKIGINIVFQNEDRKEIIQNTINNINKSNNKLTKIDLSKIVFTNDIDKDKLNLYVLKSNKEKECEKSDEIYNKHKLLKDIVIQHIGENELIDNPVAQLKMCLYNLVVKYENENSKIESFNWDEFNKHTNSKFFIFYGYKNNDDEDIYYKLKLYINGKFEFEKENYPLDVYSQETDEKSIVIVNDKNDVIKISDTENFTIPTQDIFSDEYEKITSGFNFELSNEELEELLIDILNSSDDEKLIDIANFIYDKFPDISNPDLSNVKIKMKDFKKELKSKASEEKIKGTDDFIEYIQKIYPYIKLKSNWKEMKPGGMGDLLYPNIINIFYNNEYYTVATDEYSPAKTIENNIIMRKIEVLEGENFIKEILLMLMNPIVRMDRLTVYPFIYKYIREMI